MRENAESIALLDGAAAEQARLGRNFDIVFARWRDLMLQHMRTVVVSQASSYACGVVPILLCTPRYFDGSMTLGAIMQVASRSDDGASRSLAASLGAAIRRLALPAIASA